ncbi:MAG: nucleotide exchange factor GrpE [Treponema sp.]|nr:nucleotide exchange factor GrpE [Treponema sp.]
MSTENTNTEEQQTENASQETDSKAEETSEQTSQTDSQNAEGAESAAEDPAKKIAELEAQIEELKKDALYKAAENDNWRKRMMAQKEEAVAYANANLLSDLLESLDNFDRTLDAAKDIKEAKPIVDGIKMINKSLVSMLENKYELVAYGAKGDEFNPDIHEAIGRVEDEKVKKETLQEVYLKGYKLKDRVIRHAKVMVCVPKQ